MASFIDNELKNRLVEDIEHCHAVQMEHLAGLKAGGLNKISQWLDERQAMVARLRQSLADVQPAGLDDELRALLLTKISSILDTEKELFDIAEQQRGRLAEQLTAMRRGKRALGSYGTARHNRPPRFVSDKG